MKKPRPAPELEPQEFEDRVWVSHYRTGDRGYLVEIDGVTQVRLDRPAEEILQPFHEQQWVRDDDHRPMNEVAVARIAYEADKALCPAIGIHGRQNSNWHSLSDKERQMWIKEGPKHSVRAALYASIFAGLRPYFR